MKAVRCVNDTEGKGACDKCARCGCRLYSPEVAELYELISHLVTYREKQRAEGARENQLMRLSKDIDHAAGLAVRIKWLDEIQYGITITISDDVPF